MTDPMNGRWADLDQGPAESAQMIQWHAPQTWAAVRDTVIAEIAARGWGHADRGSLALVLDKVREAGFTDGLHAARDVDRLGYAVVEADWLGVPYGIEPELYHEVRDASAHVEDSESGGIVVELLKVEEEAP